MTPTNPKNLAFLALIAALLVTLIPAATQAQSNPEADAAISKGIELRRQGKDEEALAQFQRAFKLAPTPRAKAQMGLAEQAIGRWADAERDLEEAMSHASDPWIIKQKGVLSEAMTVIRRHLGSLIVKGEPVGAVVELDGEPVGALPMPERHVTAGEVVVTVRARGHLTLSRKITVTPGELAAEVFKLKRIETESAGGAIGTTPGFVDAGSTTPPVTVVPPPPDTPPVAASPRWMRPTAWATGGVAAAALALGTTALILSQSNFNKFDGNQACGVDDVTGAVIGGADCESHHNAWKSDRTLGIVALVAGGVLGGGSAFLFYKSASAKDGRSTATKEAHLLCVPALGAGVSCALRF